MTDYFAPEFPAVRLIGYQKSQDRLHVCAKPVALPQRAESRAEDERSASRNAEGIAKQAPNRAAK